MLHIVEALHCPFLENILMCRQHYLNWYNLYISNLIIKVFLQSQTYLNKYLKPNYC
ncbi:hypothetical protein FDUTEX481_08764 [Tolypothrix sp. PCC 7601]|nr:hypothetical protein FDUTEX481_08764 [Tolypothrix sp. PCC 7601]